MANGCASTPMTGSCQCGAIGYQVVGPPCAIYVCHCHECQKQSASAFGISVIVHADALSVVRGEPQSWSRPTDSGNTLTCIFCPDCGSRLWHATPARATISVKGGSLDTPVDLSGAIHIWTVRKLAGVIIPPEARRFPGEPDEP